ncbi:hypothetical protein ACFP81_09135 [Deinococcus lacus]|uniref:DUF1269 domain-containing protein n=1 Tax=Deinococcus lacus TaxID=392561 RepID=A0ABW1YD08_9DEIO
MDSVVALFSEPQQARHALEALQARGFQREHLGFAMSNPDEQRALAEATGVSPEAGAPAGAGGVIRGAIMGAIAGLVLTIPVWILLALIPGTRIYVDGGMYSALFGLLGGLALGGLFGALSGSDHGSYVDLLRSFGIPRRHAEGFYQAMQGGHVLVIARDPSGHRADEATELMRQLGARSLEEGTTARSDEGSKLQSERSGHRH